MAVTSWLQELTTDRPSTGGERLVRGVRCRRVGRNDVWRAEDGQSVYFVTFCRNASDFHRRLAGIDISSRIARQTPGVGSPCLEVAIADSLTIVTREAPGVPVEGLFRAAFRIDRNPFRRRSPRQAFLAALESISGFLMALHESEPVADHLRDHGHESVAARIHAQLERLSSRVVGLRGWGLAAPSRLREVASGVVLGDMALGNFVFDGRQLTCVDFEDLGIGDAYRDRVLLSQTLKHPLGQWHYWHEDADRLLGLVPEDPLYAFYALELDLQGLWRELSRVRRSRAVVERGVESVRRKLAIVAASGGL